MVYSFPSFTVSFGNLMSQQCSAGHSLRKLASVSAFAGPILLMSFPTITFLALLKPSCANGVFPHQAGITQRSPCFLTPRSPTYPRCRWNCWSAQCPPAAGHPGSLTRQGRYRVLGSQFLQRKLAPLARDFVHHSPSQQ